MERNLQYFSVGNIFKRCSSEKIIRSHKKASTPDTMPKLSGLSQPIQHNTQLPSIYHAKFTSKLLKNFPIFKCQPQVNANPQLSQTRVNNPIFKRRVKSGGEASFFNPRITPKFGGFNL